MNGKVTELHTVVNTCSRTKLSLNNSFPLFLTRTI